MGADSHEERMGHQTSWIRFKHKVQVSLNKGFGR